MILWNHLPHIFLGSLALTQGLSFYLSFKCSLVTEALTMCSFCRCLKHVFVTSEKFGVGKCSNSTTTALFLSFLIDITFFCQLTLFNGLRRFSYIDITSLCLMIPCFDPTHGPQVPHSTYSSFPITISLIFGYSCHSCSHPQSPAPPSFHSVLHSSVFNVCLSSSYRL